MSRNVMIDIETLDIHPGGLILSIGAVRFGTGDRGQFYHNIDVLSSLMAGFTVDEKTISWWRSQGPEVTNVLKQKSLPVKQVLKSLATFLDKDDQVWAKGPDFDLVILSHAYELVEMKVPWSFRNARDVRTMIWLGEQMGMSVREVRRPEPFIKHFALHDAAYQANIVQTVADKLGVAL